MKLFASLLLIFVFTTCNVKINPEYHYMSYHALDISYEDALEKIKEIHEKNPHPLYETFGLENGINHPDNKHYQTYFVISETSQVALCTFFGQVKDYSLVVMTHYHDLETFGKVTYKDIRDKEKEGYTQEEIDRFNKSKEIFEAQILDKFGDSKRIGPTDLKMKF
ncbi:MAG: hypothetical protein QM660_12140 [Dysgonomonas sp.]